MTEESEQEQVRRQLILDYKAVFAGSRGLRVLADLESAFGVDRPTSGPGVKMKEVFRRECMKHPIYHIRAKLSASLEPITMRKAKSNTPQLS